MCLVDKLWYKYVYMEETLGNVAGARQIFERWMSWEPDEAAWSSYIKMEKRYGEMQRARAIFERFTACVPPIDECYVKYTNIVLQSTSGT